MDQTSGYYNFDSQDTPRPSFNYKNSNEKEQWFVIALMKMYNCKKTDITIEIRPDGYKYYILFGKRIIRREMLPKPKVDTPPEPPK